jgi:hypothetical protein
MQHQWRPTRISLFPSGLLKNFPFVSCIFARLANNPPASGVINALKRSAGPKDADTAPADLARTVIGKGFQA